MSSYHDLVRRLRDERWPQRQDSTMDQVRDLIPIADAIGCQDAADLMRNFIQFQEDLRFFRRISQSW